LLSELEDRPAVAVANDMATVRSHCESIRPARKWLVDILKKHIRGGQSEKIAEEYSQRLDVLAEDRIINTHSASHHLSSIDKRMKTVE
jgi:hypothetical protein